MTAARTLNDRLPTVAALGSKQNQEIPALSSTSRTWQYTGFILVPAASHGIYEFPVTRSSIRGVLATATPDYVGGDEVAYSSR